MGYREDIRIITTKEGFEQINNYITNKLNNMKYIRRS